MMVRTETKAAVLSAMCDIGRAAKQSGEDAFSAIEKAFPGVPTVVITEAWLAVDDESTEAWWDKLEKTIDGEIVNQSLRLVGA